MKVNLSPQQLRRSIVEMAWAGESVHIACAFSIVEIVSVLLADVMKLGTGVNDLQRDRIFLSKGHGVMALYAGYAELGWLERSHLDAYFADGSHLHGLSEARVSVLEVSSGSLGHGLPVAVGYAFGKKRKGESGHTYCIVGDGEMNEGSMWEALLFAGHHQLDNLTVIVDANGHQAMGRIEDVIKMEPFVEKFKAFGFDSIECDGHSRSGLQNAFLETHLLPRAIVARTVKGKGLSFMQGKNEWHYRRLTQELVHQARQELAEAPSA